MCSSNVEVHDIIAEDATVNDVHNNAEVFDRKTEVAFKYLQVGRARALVRNNGGGGACRQPDQRLRLAPCIAGVHRLLQLLLPRLQRRG